MESKSAADPFLTNHSHIPISGFWKDILTGIKRNMLQSYMSVLCSNYAVLTAYITVQDDRREVSPLHLGSGIFPVPWPWFFCFCRGCGLLASTAVNPRCWNCTKVLGDLYRCN